MNDLSIKFNIIYQISSKFIYNQRVTYSTHQTEMGGCVGCTDPDRKIRANNIDSLLKTKRLNQPFIGSNQPNKLLTDYPSPNVNSQMKQKSNIYKKQQQSILLKSTTNSRIVRKHIKEKTLKQQQVQHESTIKGNLSYENNRIKAKSQIQRKYNWKYNEDSVYQQPPKMKTIQQNSQQINITKKSENPHKMDESLFYIYDISTKKKTDGKSPSSFKDALKSTTNKYEHFCMESFPKFPQLPPFKCFSLNKYLSQIQDSSTCRESHINILISSSTGNDNVQRSTGVS